jgi:hypothetical protein
MTKKDEAGSGTSNVLDISKDPKVPVEGSQNVDPKTTKEITFKFNREINKATITTETVQLLGKDDALVSTLEFKFDDNDKSKVVISLLKNLDPDTTYTIKVNPDVAYMQGNKVGKEISWTFKTT